MTNVWLHSPKNSISLETEPCFQLQCKVLLRTDNEALLFMRNITPLGSTKDELLFNSGALHFKKFQAVLKIFSNLLLSQRLDLEKTRSTVPLLWLLGVPCY